MKKENADINKKAVNVWNIASPAISCFVSLVLVFAILCYLQSCLVVDIDNYFISLVSNGLYSEDSYCLFINPVLSVLIGILAKINPSIDWFMILLRASVFIGLLWISFCILSSRIKRVSCFATILILVFLVADVRLFNANFTIASSFFAAVGLLSLVAYIKSDFWPNSNTFRRYTLGFGVFYYGLSFLFRWECAILSIPFALIVLIPLSLDKDRLKICSDDIDGLRKSWRGLALVVLVSFILIASMFAVKHSAAYEEAVEYNSARSAIVDYPTRSYSEVSSNLDWLNENDYALVQSWFFGDTVFYDSGSLQQIAESARTTAVNSLFSLESIKQACKSVLEYPVYIFVVALALGCAFVKGDRVYRLKLLVCLLAAACVFVYYSYSGRLPFRIIVSIYIFLLVFSLMPFLFEKNSEQRAAWRISKDNLIPAAVCAFMLIVCLFSIPSWKEGYEKSAIGEVEQFKSALMVDELGEDYIIFWSSSAYVQPYRLAGALPDKEYLSHNIPMGTWVYGQPYFVDFLESREAVNPVEALVERENTYYLSANPERVLTFIRDHYKKDVVMNQVGEYCGYAIWDFS